MNKILIFLFASLFIFWTWPTPAHALESAQSVREHMNKAEASRKLECQRDWISNAEIAISSTADNEDCSVMIRIPVCVTDETVDKEVARLRKLGYSVRPDTYENGIDVGWCSK
jgi:hypothetical protein